MKTFYPGSGPSLRPVDSFELVPAQARGWEAEARRAPGPRPRSMPRATPPPPRPRRPDGGRPIGPPRGSRPRPLRGRPRWPGYGLPLPRFGIEGALDDVAGGSEYVRWTQDCLNRVMAAGLAVDGVMHAAARSVLRRFQQREGLPVTGIAGPDTEAALRRACAAVAERAAGAAPAGELGTARRAWSAELSLPAAIADPRSAGPGIYTLYRNGQRLYVGKAQDLRRRLQQHLWCLQHLGVAAGRYAVKLTPMRGATPAQLQRVESAAIARWGRRGKGGMLTNVKSSELEVEPWGEAWR